MSDELILSSTNSESLDRALSVASNVEFLPRLKLCQGGSNEVAEGDIARGGNFGLIRDQDDIEDIGSEMEVVLVEGRAKALLISDDEIIQNFDPSTETFQSIKSQSAVKDSGAMYGPEFLVWLPAQQCFATFFLGSKTGRRAAKKFKPLMGTPAILKSVLIDPPGSKYKWHGPVIAATTTPLSEVPDQEAREKAVKMFLEEKATEVKIAEDADSAEGGDSAARER